MHNLLYNISQVLGITIIHSLWQGLIIYIALRLFLLAMPAVSSVSKYRISYATLVGMLGWFLVTLFKELGQYNWLSTVALPVTQITLPGLLHSVDAPANRLYFTIAQYMPFLTMVYVVGLVFNTLKLTLAWNSIYRIRQNIKNAGFEGTVKRLSTKLNVTKTVQAAFSEWVDVPCITGFIKPIILLPVSITTYLSTDEIEAILLHELAHIKRNDYLLNFIQQVIGILLFFNPFARLVANVINEERENCCDDVVVQVTGSPFLYAQALLKLEENKQQRWQLALAATGKKYELLNRIERIMKTKTQTVNIRPVLITVLALTCSISSIAWLNPEIKNGKVIIKNAPAIRMITAAITTPEEAPKPVVASRKHKKKLSVKLLGDTTQLAALNDTTKKKYKIVIEDENGVKKEYNSINDMPAEDRENFTNSGEMHLINDSLRVKLNKLYSSDKWKKQTELMALQGKKMAEHFNSPEWKKQQKIMVEKSLAMAKMATGKKFQKQAMELGLQAGKMAQQFNGPEFAKKMAEMQKNGEDIGKYVESDEFKKSIEGMTKYYDSPEFKKQIEGMAKYYDSPKFKKSMEKMDKYYQGKDFKNYMKDIEKYGEDMGKYYDSPEGQKALEEMSSDTTRKVKGYLIRTKDKPAKTPRPPKALKGEQLPPPPPPAKGLKGKELPPPPPPAVKPEVSAAGDNVPL
jgi:beta-lactamase regulating signal transducer with metallopeptidase domain